MKNIWINGIPEIVNFDLFCPDAEFYLKYDVGVGKAHFAFFFILRYIVVLCMRHLEMK